MGEHLGSHGDAGAGGIPAEIRRRPRPHVRPRRHHGGRGGVQIHPGSAHAGAARRADPDSRARPAGVAMTEDLPTYEVLAVRFGSSSARPGSQNFIMPAGHDEPQQVAFYIWVIRREGRTIVVDTGFSPGASSRRNRQFVHAPAEALAQAGVNVVAVGDLLLTPLHWDQA